MTFLPAFASWVIGHQFNHTPCRTQSTKCKQCPPPKLNGLFFILTNALDRVLIRWNGCKKNILFARPYPGGVFMKDCFLLVVIIIPLTVSTGS